MSRQIKKNCQQIMNQLQRRLLELKQSLKLKKFQTVSQKILAQIISDFKFLHDDLNIILNHLGYVQNQLVQKDIIIDRLQKQLVNKNAQKKTIQQMLKQKYQKQIKQIQFMSFSGKNNIPFFSKHQRTKSDVIKKGLNQLEKDIVQANKRVCNKVKQIKNQIQNNFQQKQLHKYQNVQKNLLTLNNGDFLQSKVMDQNVQCKLTPKIQFQNLDFSDIMVNNNQANTQRTYHKYQKSTDLLSTQKNHQQTQRNSNIKTTKKQSFSFPKKVASQQLINTNLNSVNRVESHKTFTKNNMKSKNKLMQYMQKNQQQQVGKIQKGTKMTVNQPEKINLDVKINKKKKQQLAELIAKQSKIIVSKDKYFSTDF